MNQPMQILRGAQDDKFEGSSASSPAPPYVALCRCAFGFSRASRKRSVFGRHIGLSGSLEGSKKKEFFFFAIEAGMLLKTNDG
jgi:hypothetical protein